MPSKEKLKISFNAYYSYKKKVKEQFLFLRIENGLAILGRVDQKLMVSEHKFPLIDMTFSILN